MGKIQEILDSGQFPGISSNDICDPFKSQANGKYYSSKKKYRADLRAMNYIELGNERVKPKKFKPPDLTETLHRTLKEIKR